MSDPHLACYQLEARLRDEIDRLQEDNKSLEIDLESTQYELEEAEDQLARSHLNTETEIEANYRTARERLDDEIISAEHKATTAKVFTNTAEHSQEWHTAYIAGLRHAAKLLAP